MLKKICTVLVMLFPLISWGQYNNEEYIASRFKPGFMWFYTGLRPAQPEKVRRYDRLIFDITYNDWNGDLKSFKNDWKSIGLNTSLMFDIPITKGNTISFGTGLTHSLFRISSTGHYFAPDSLHRFTTHTAEVNNGFVPVPDRYLCGNGLGIPLEFRFRTKGWKHFKVHAGGRVGYQFNIYSKAITEGLDGDIIEKFYNFPDVNRLTYSAHIRMGIRNWALYASYNFNSLFSDNNSVDLKLIQFGLTVSLF
ncbi:MAG: hypothetical protein ACK457_07835 [Flavobacteriia bacterium]|jgi:hypothetical protein